MIILHLRCTFIKYFIFLLFYDKIEKREVAVMNKNIASPIKSRVVSYYKYFLEMKMKNHDRITAEEIREHFGFNNTSIVTHDIRLLIENPGRKRYGYNVNFVCRELKKLVGLNEPCVLTFVGDDSFQAQFNLLKESLTSSGFIVGDYITELSKNNLEGCQYLVVTKHYETDLSNFIPDSVTCLYDLGLNKMDDYKGYKESFDIWECLLQTWKSSIEYESEV